MNFIEGRTYRFKPKNQKDTPRSGHLEGIFGMVYLRHVGKVALFRSPSGGWLESFTRAQAEDYEITERKSPSAKGLPKGNANKVRAQQRPGPF